MISPEVNQALVRVAEGFGNRLNEFIFVGGAVAGLLVTDPLAPVPRPTADVDVVVDVVSYVDLTILSDHLRENGFIEDPSGPICRWNLGGLRVDVMPTRPNNPLGFSNRWYPDAVAGAWAFKITPNISIRVISGVHFVATKLEAFGDRGKGDFMASHDLEDIIAVVDGRPTIVDEVARVSDSAAAFVRQRLDDLLNEADFTDAIAGHLPGDEGSQRRLPIVLGRLRSFAAQR
jgi:hypothetical protein